MRLAGSSPGKVAYLLEQLSHTGDGVFGVDRKRRIVLWNRAARSLLGYRAEEVLGRYCYEVIQGCDGDGAQICGMGCPHFARAKKLRWASHQQLRTRTKSEQDVCIDMSTVAVLSPRSQLTNLIHIFRKTTETDRLTRHDATEVAGKSPQMFPPLANSITPPVYMAKLETVPTSRRERAVLHHLAEGMATREIAAHLCISPTTVRNHVQSILRKLQVHSRLEAIVWAFHRGWL